MKTPATPHNDAEGFLKAMTQLGFQSNQFDRPGRRQLIRNNAEGHTTLRVTVYYEGESRPHNLSLVKFNGQRNQLVEWASMNLSAHMPTAGVLALIKAA